MRCWSITAKWNCPAHEGQNPSAIQLRLDSENRDVPLIVTTTGQLLEPLLSNRPSQVRRILSLARSVIVLDEM